MYLKQTVSSALGKGYTGKQFDITIDITWTMSAEMTMALPLTLL